MAYNNTYGLQVINETVYEMAMAAVPACLQLVRDCRSLSEEYDPDQSAFNETVNAVCTNATATCAAIGAAYDMVSNVSHAVDSRAFAAFLYLCFADDARFPRGPTSIWHIRNRIPSRRTTSPPTSIRTGCKRSWASRSTTPKILIS